MVAQFHAAALAPSTLSSYSSGVRSYQLFCLHAGLVSFPPSELTLQRYASSLGNRVSYSTIKVYLAGVQYTSIMMGYHIALSDMPQLHYLLRGIRRAQGATFRRPRRQPITYVLLRIIHYRIQFLQYSPCQRLMFRTATALAFFGLLRVSEYTSSGRTRFNATTTLLCTDVSFNSDHSIMIIVLRASKTDPFRIGCSVRIGASGGSTCSVSLMRQYLQLRGVSHGPLFQLGPNSFLIREDIVSLLRCCLPGVQNVNTHSFRIGGASAAASAGVPDSRIQILGRWSSDAYRRYIHVSDESIISLSRSLVSTNHCSRVWDPCVGGSVLAGTHM